MFRMVNAFFFSLIGNLAIAHDFVHVVGCPGKVLYAFLKRRDPRNVVANVGQLVKIFLDGKWLRGKVADFPENEHQIDIVVDDGRYGRVDLMTRRHHLDLTGSQTDLPDPRGYDAMLGQRIEYSDPGRTNPEVVRAYVVAIDLEMGRFILRRELRKEEAVALGVPRRPETEHTIESRIAPLHSIPFTINYRVIVEPSRN